ncbi:hypothetical protein [Photobacterium lutimaris]|uniref:Uncharacterized protein n=1 Tax=Photobacterium lutimaris TaxID=388278 RepID=A0A2T3IIA4_9GAMM|nr:hypothetical protein [Photobacterium lutimaris]PSU28077.1 hypothetical protein C9I99_26430 [Photobacterium lutimaris]TDR70177.1 hypothetical protein DFP78_12419 [Photobacterium lutimaris]
MINNWTVITQPVRLNSKGVAARERYLNSIEHPNHKNTTSITSLFGSKETSELIALKGEQYLLKQNLTGKRGRRLSSYAVEYCLTLPKGIIASDEQWKFMVSYCCKMLFSLCKLDQKYENQFKESIRAVLHRQDQKIYSGTGDHVHLLISKVIIDGRPIILHELQRKIGTKIIKNAFNIAVLKVLGLSNLNYKPHEMNKGKRLEIWKKHKLDLNNELQSKKIILKIQNQIDKWYLAYDDHNFRQMNRQFNRISKSYSDLSKLNFVDIDTFNRIESCISDIKKITNNNFN